MTGWQVLAETLDDLKTCGMEPTGHAPTVMEAAADQTGSSVSGTWALASVQQAERQYAIPAALAGYEGSPGSR